MKRWGIYVGVILWGMSHLAMAAPERCGPCANTLGEIERLLEAFRQMERHREDLLSGRTEPLRWEAPSPESSRAPESPFHRRLELLAEFEASQKRLASAEKTLSQLEASLAGDGTAAESPESRERREQLKQVALTQRILLEEMRAHLKRVEARFAELDRRLDAHEQRISAFEGEVDDLTASLRNLSDRVRAHAVSRSDRSYGSVREMLERESPPGKPVNFPLPRTEVTFEERDLLTFEVTASAGGNLFGSVEGEVSTGVVYEANLSAEVYLVAPGIRPLFSRSGKLTRDSVAFCGISRTYTLKGYGAVRASTGLDIYVVKAKAGTRLEVGKAVAARARAYSPLAELPEGLDLASLRHHCRRFVRQYANEVNFAEEVSELTRVEKTPEAGCHTHFQCRDTVRDGWVRYTAIGQCVNQEDTRVCRPRYVNRGGTCLLPGERPFAHRYPCAEGFTCEPVSRRCLPERTAGQWLQSAGLRDARVLSLSEPPPHRKAPECPQGWRLPGVEELEPVVAWWRLFQRDRTRRAAERDKIPTGHWYYPESSHRGVVWSAGGWGYHLGTDAVVHLSRGEGEARNAAGVVICVQPHPEGPASGGG